MLNRSAQTRVDQRTYIPPHIEQAMSQHMQQNLPAHLKQYTGPNKPAYVPQHIEKQLSTQLQKNMPGHLKQYSNAYMQQRVIQPSAAGASALPQVSQPSGAPPTPPRLRRDHNISGSGQHTVDPNTLQGAQALFQPEQQPAQPQPGTSFSPDQPTGYQQPYDFILNPAQPPKKTGVNLPGGSSKAMRALFIVGLVLLLLIGFSIFRNLLSSKPNLASIVSVAQDQQVLVHLSTEASQPEQGKQLSPDSQNFVATTQLSLASTQSKLVQYLQTNGQKVDAKQLTLKISAETDKRLETAAAATTYEETLQEIMKDELTEYMSHLQQTYDQTTGQNGRTLLSQAYDEAELLLTQLDQATKS